MYYDSLPDWSELNRRIEANEELDPVEQFIYDNEPSVHSEAEEFRKQFQLALSFYGGAPLNNSEEKQNDQPTQVKTPAAPTREEILQAVTRGWCVDVNIHKVIDDDLAESITDQLVKLLLT